MVPIVVTSSVGNDGGSSDLTEVSCVDDSGGLFWYKENPHK